MMRAEARKLKVGDKRMDADEERLDAMGQQLDDLTQRLNITNEFYNYNVAEGHAHAIKGLKHSRNQGCCTGSHMRKTNE